MQRKLIVIEGLDGCGKNTQVALLEKYFEDKMIKVKKLSFPNYSSASSSLIKMYLNSEFGESPEEVNPYAAASFFAVDRFAEFKKQWAKDYQENTVIISDRYTTSNAIYQMCKLKKDQWDSYLSWLYDYEYVKLEIPKPNLVIYLKGEISASQHLMEMRYNGDNTKKDLHESNILFLKKCEEAAKFIAQKDGWLEVDCFKGEKMKSKQEIHKEIVSLIGGVQSEVRLS